MNEFTSKKLGEVLAFTNQGLELLDRADAALGQAFDSKILNSLKVDLLDQQEKLKKLANDIMLDKAGKTGDKLRGMAETYIGDEWDNPTELLEWLGFFEGAALVHWQLVLGAVEGEAELSQLAQAGLKLHESMLKEVRSSLHRIGGERARPV